jgi:hypothetical protein
MFQRSTPGCLLRGDLDALGATQKSKQRKERRNDQGEPNGSGLPQTVDETGDIDVH